MFSIKQLISTLLVSLPMLLGLQHSSADSDAAEKCLQQISSLRERTLASNEMISYAREHLRQGPGYVIIPTARWFTGPEWRDLQNQLLDAIYRQKPISTRTWAEDVRAWYYLRYGTKNILYEPVLDTINDEKYVATEVENPEIFNQSAAIMSAYTEWMDQFLIAVLRGDEKDYELVQVRIGIETQERKSWHSAFAKWLLGSKFYHHDPNYITVVTPPIDGPGT